jgi:Ca2+-binding RTX toxin-like protein
VVTTGDQYFLTFIDLSKFDLTALKNLGPAVSDTAAVYSLGSFLSETVTLTGTGISYSHIDQEFTSGSFANLNLVVSQLGRSVEATFSNLGFDDADVNLLFTSKSAGLARLLAGNDVISGGNGNDVLLGLEGRDDLRGHDGNDKIYGGAGSDVLYGHFGNDYIDGGSSSDIMFGGRGNDWYIIDDRGDKVRELKDLPFNPSLDTIESGNLSLDLGSFKYIERAALTGDRDLRLWGSADDDYLIGNEGDNLISGRAGTDAMRGNGGSDTLYGGSGRDVMTGGNEDDRFLFRNWRESEKRAPDQITDFKPGEDRIDVRAVDANSLSAGNAAFRLLSARDADFSGQAGELRWFHSGTTTVIQGDVTGDGVADLVIRLNGKVILTSGDFVL